MRCPSKTYTIYKIKLPLGVVGPGEVALDDEVLVAMDEAGVTVRGVAGLEKIMRRSSG